MKATFEKSINILGLFVLLFVCHLLVKNEMRIWRTTEKVEKEERQLDTLRAAQIDSLLKPLESRQQTSPAFAF